MCMALQWGVTCRCKLITHCGKCFNVSPTENRMHEYIYFLSPAHPLTSSFPKCLYSPLFYIYFKVAQFIFFALKHLETLTIRYNLCQQLVVFVILITESIYRFFYRQHILSLFCGFGSCLFISFHYFFGIWLVFPQSQSFSYRVHQAEMIMCWFQRRLTHSKVDDIYMYVLRISLFFFETICLFFHLFLVLWPVVLRLNLIFFDCLVFSCDATLFGLGPRLQCVLNHFLWESLSVFYGHQSEMHREKHKISKFVKLGCISQLNWM